MRCVWVVEFREEGEWQPSAIAAVSRTEAKLFEQEFRQRHPDHAPSRIVLYVPGKPRAARTTEKETEAMLRLADTLKDTP
jgi:hypothetical protein